MTTRAIQLSTIALAFSMLAACGPKGEDAPDGYWLDDFQCERLERETFEDCMYEEGLSVSGDPRLFEDQKTQIRDFCASPCNRTGGVSVNYATNVTDLKLVRGLEETEGGFGVYGGDIETLEGTQALQSVGRNFSLVETGDLESISSLRSLTTVGRAFRIEGPTKLKTLDGLQNLETAHRLTIQENEQLESIEELESLQGVTYLEISDNPKLPRCQAEELAQRIDVDPENVTIRGNGTGSCD